MHTLTAGRVRAVCGTAKKIARRTALPLAGLCALLVLGSCRDQDVLLPSSTAGPPPKPSTSIAVAGWVRMFGSEPGWETSDVADLNADGKVDLMQHHRRYLWTSAIFLDGTNFWGLSTMPRAASSDWQIVGVADLSADWDPDIVWQNRVTREVGAWIMWSGTEVRSWVVIGSAASSDWEIGGVADMTGDAKPDIVWQNRVTRQVGAWIMDGTTVRSWVVIGSASSSEWEIADAADMDLDGMADIVWQNRATREVGTWLMNRTSVTGWVAIGSAASSEWRIGGVGDVNGDRQPDIVWHNPVTLENGAWIMGGAPPPPPPALPSEARHRVSHTSFRIAPYGFKGATPWIAAVHTGDPSVPSAVEIGSIELWAEIDGRFPLVSNHYYDGVAFAGELGDRVPWLANPTRPMPGTVLDGVPVIRPSDRPDRVWHPYLESSVDISRATNVWFRARVRLHGPVAVQAGIDYHEQLGYRAQPRVVEGAVTDWENAQDRWITLTIERSTEVGLIELSPAVPDNRYPVGSTITATFHVINRDDDAIRLAGVGIETRRLPAGDTHCDPEKLERVEAFSWAMNVDLAPSHGQLHAAQWRPTVAGDYCVRVVEQRLGVKHADGTPVYQQPYSSAPFQVIRVQ